MATLNPLGQWFKDTSLTFSRLNLLVSKDKTKCLMKYWVSWYWNEARTSGHLSGMPPTGLLHQEEDGARWPLRPLLWLKWFFHLWYMAHTLTHYVSRWLVMCNHFGLRVNRFLLVQSLFSSQWPCNLIKSLSLPTSVVSSLKAWAGPHGPGSSWL
jgi:hypothetical protein